MDFSAILILPYSALLTIVTLTAALLIKRARPRLIWPFALATLSAAPVFIGLPSVSELGLWIALFFSLSVWAAFGTAIGAMVVALSRATVRAFKGE